MQETSHPVVAAYVWGVRIVYSITVLVMLSVHGAPPEEIALHSHGAGNAQEDFHPSRAVECLVREIAVEPDRDAQTAKEVHPGEE